MLGVNWTRGVAKSPKRRHTPGLGMRACIGLLALLVAGCSCSDGEDKSAASAPPKSPYSDYAIHVLVGPSDDQKQLDIPPAPAARARARRLQAALEPNSGSSKPLASAEVGDAGLVDLDDQAVPMGWLLLLRAAAHCGDPDIPIGEPWGANFSGEYPEEHWFIFEGRYDSASGGTKFSSCDEIYRHSEILLCTANALAEVADAVAPIVWPARSDTSGGAANWLPQFGEQWIIPVQAEKDKFIARDLALNVLANLARLDLEVPASGLDDNESCPAAYVRSTTDTTEFAALGEVLYGSGRQPDFFYPKYAVEFENSRELARDRLSLEMHILRAAGRLVRDLVEKSVYADLAGAEAQRARSGDPVRGAQLLWGAATDADQPYNSMAHALRVLSGRLESASPTVQAADPEVGASVPAGDPTCGGHLAMELLTGSLDDGFSARWSDRMLRTTEQQRATALLEASRIVVPSASTDTAAQLSVVRAAIVNQLALTAAVDVGITDENTQDFTDFRTGLRGSAIEAAVSELSDANLRFALARGFDAYRLMSAAPATLQDVNNPTQFMAPVALAGAAQRHTSLSAVGGGVLAAPHPRFDIATDVSARLGAAAAASKCAEPPIPIVGEPGLFDIDNMGKVSAYQNVFLLGDTYRRRINVIRENARNAGFADGVVEAAEAASAELRAWTGPTILFWEGGGSFDFVLMGITADEVVAENKAAMAEQIVLVFGPPWVAECAANLRSSCPEDFWQDYVVESGGFATDENFPFDLSYWKSLDGRILYTGFPTNIKAGFNPTPTAEREPAQEFFYLVARGDPANPSRGRVLATFPYRGPQVYALAAVSPLERRLVDEAYAINPRAVTHGPEIAGRPLVEMPSFCAAGIPKDFFVPLENELTSDSDGYENSWKHYLNLAAQSAQETDQLCREIIDLGLQKDLRREVAGEELAAICGDFSALSSIPFEKGTVEDTKDDDALNQCLGESTKDVVFLTTDPYETETDLGEKTRLIKENHLKCGPATATPPFTGGPGASNPLCQKPELSIEALGLADAVENTTGTGDSPCKALKITNLGIAFNHFGGKISKNSLSKLSGVDTPSLAMMIGSLRLQVDEDLEWELLSDGVPVMSTTATGLWPHCVIEQPACTVPGLLTPLEDWSLAQRLRGLFGAGIDTLSASKRDLALYRVSGAMWTMGAIAGWIPAGRFQVPVLAANFSAIGSLAQEPGPLIYGSGAFANQGAGIYRLTVTSGVTGDDSDALKDLHKVKKEFADAAENSARPSWLRHAYGRADVAAGANQDTDHYLHAIAKNPTLTFDHTKHLTNMVPPSDAPQWLADLGQHVQGGIEEVGGTCSYGDNEAWWLVRRVGALKRSAQRGTLCQFNGRPLMAYTYEPQLSNQESYTGTYIADRVAWLADMLMPDSGTSCEGCVPLNKLMPGVFEPQKGWLRERNRKHGGPISVLSGEDPTCTPIDISYGPTNMPPGGPGATQSQELVATYSPACVRNSHGTDGVATSLVTTYCRKESRAQLFVNSHVPFDPCHAVRDITGAYGLACILADEIGTLALGGEDMPVPEIQSPDEIIRFETWLDFQAVKARRTLQNLVLQSVPDRVVNDMKKGNAGTGALKGEYGQLILQYEQGISSIISGWIAVAAGIKSIKNAIAQARIELELTKIDKQSKEAQLAMSHLQVEMQVAKAAVSAAAGIASFTEGQPAGGISGVGNAAVDLYFADKQKELLDQMAALAEAENAAKVVAALNNLHTSTSTSYASLQSSLEGLRSATLGVMQTSVALQYKKAQAKYAAAKGAGQDWVEVGTGFDGDKATFPVNAVLRRQYDIGQRRYEESLKHSRYMAYVAQLAIEQRIGQRLKEIHEKVGPLDAPVNWYTDLCRFQGCDYDKLREIDTTEYKPGDPKPIDYSQYAEPFIGDYVNKLRNFVEYYNIEYPAHEADDVAVLSVRDDLLGSGGQCYAESKNQLHYSHDLTEAEGDGTPVVRGWGIEPCSVSGAKCLLARTAASLEAAIGVAELPPQGFAQSGMTWLYDVANTPFQTPATPTPGIPPHSVFQAVELSAGTTYVLSWWESARDENGLPADPNDPPTEPYSAAVYAPSGVVIPQSVYDAPPFVKPAATSCGAGGGACVSHNDCCSGVCIMGPPGGTCASPWMRRSVAFTASASGSHNVTFSASSGGSNLGSVAIANVQLEVTPSASSGPTAYEATGASRLILTNNCVAGTPEKFRSMFNYACTNNECYFELGQPILVDTTLLDMGEGKLVGKLARGNFNYRHISVAANVVGTGVSDCTSNPTPSCYGSAYLEYTLVHEAKDTPVIDYLGKAKSFDFGIAKMQRAKALAAERFITLPVGSADSSLLAQPQVTKPEFRGRPLSGSYRLRIYDQPSLVWHQIEDIQLVWTYRYWSRIARESSSK
jgi:hypothetical protein